MNVSPELLEFIRQDILPRFCRYVRVCSTSDGGSETNPSTKGQIDLIDLLEQELRSEGVDEIARDENHFLYVRLQGNCKGAAIGLLAHVDTSPDQSGEGVDPQIHTNWNGSPIHFRDDPHLTWSADELREMRAFTGDTIVTAAGCTLLGADDKAGVAALMTSLVAWHRFPNLQRTDLVVCFTHDEEIGRGVRGLDLSRLPTACYTIDGGLPGQLETECFDAYSVEIDILGAGVHPGYAKGKLINAAAWAARLVAMLPQAVTPEHTEGREGFWHLTHIDGDHERARVHLILRDFEKSQNLRRLDMIDRACQVVQHAAPGIKVTMNARQQYENMGTVLLRAPAVVERARSAMREAGIEPVESPIRGGTDGSLLSSAGHPTPNLFAGGALFHSRKEWIALSAMEATVRTILALARPTPHQEEGK